MMDREQYLADPCKAASLPYWKEKMITIPDGMRILHRNDFNESENLQYTDEPYFRLRHDMKGLSAPALPRGYSLCPATLHQFAVHINSCYDGIGVTAEEMQRSMSRPVYDETLWLAVRDDHSGEIAATGIAELDREIGEGILEWVQVSGNHRRHGLGRYLVSELLWRMRGKANFATVSGQCHNPTNPEALYRKCGFSGNDVWHVLRKR